MKHEIRHPVEPVHYSSPLIIGHRGAAAVAPENTLVSFKRALKDGADGIEFDVRLASDGVPVVIHDDDLRRTARREGKVAHFSSAELNSMDAGTWFNLRYPAKACAEYALANVPTLEEILHTFSQSATLFYVEMKCATLESNALAAQVAKLIRAYSLTERTVVESFNLDSIREIKRIDASIQTAALFDRSLAHPVPSKRKIIERATRCRANEIALHYTLTTRRFAEDARARGMKTVVWTVDRPAWIERARRYGLHAVITNDPARMRARCREILAA